MNPGGYPKSNVDADVNLLHAKITLYIRLKYQLLSLHEESKVLKQTALILNQDMQDLNRNLLTSRETLLQCTGVAGVSSSVPESDPSNHGQEPSRSRSKYLSQVLAVTNVYLGLKDDCEATFQRYKEDRFKYCKLVVVIEKYKMDLEDVMRQVKPYLSFADTVNTVSTSITTITLYPYRQGQGFFVGKRHSRNRIVPTCCPESVPQIRHAPTVVSPKDMEDKKIWADINRKLAKQKQNSRSSRISWKTRTLAIGTFGTWI